MWRERHSLILPRQKRKPTSEMLPSEAVSFCDEGKPVPALEQNDTVFTEIE